MIYRHVTFDDFVEAFRDQNTDDNHGNFTRDGWEPDADLD